MGCLGASTPPTFWVLVLVCDIHARAAAHGLGADVPANGPRVYVVLLLAIVRGRVDPGDAIGIDFRIDEGHVKIQVHVSLSDCDN